MKLLMEQTQLKKFLIPQSQYSIKGRQIMVGPIYTDNIKSNLQRYRLKRNLTQQQLSDMSGVNLERIRRYETKRYDINKAEVSAVVKLADVLMCDVRDIMENIMEN